MRNQNTTWTVWEIRNGKPADIGFVVSASYSGARDLADRIYGKAAGIIR